MSKQCENGNCKVNETEENEENISKKEIILYIIAVIIFALTFIPKIQNNIEGALYFISILLAGYKLLVEGILNLLHFKFEEDTLMTIAIISACILGDFMEGALVIILFRLGEFIENRAIKNSNSHIQNIAKIQAKTANLIKSNQEIQIVNVEEVKKEDSILIKPGEMIPVDCIVINGTSQIDTSNITGESEPVITQIGQELLSGAMNLTGSLTCKVIREWKDSTASQIVDLVYEATNNKGKAEKFITKFSKIYTPIVLILALAITLIPLIMGLDFQTWFTRALVFLVASCPCSIVISIPLAFFSCIGNLSKKGMLMKGTKHIEAFTKAKIIAFDKTGTITTGKMTIDKVILLTNSTEEEVLTQVYALEKNSNHPISTAIYQKVKEKNLENNIQTVENYQEIAGHGIYGEINKQKIILGNQKLLNNYQIKVPESLPKEAIYLAKEEKIIAAILLTEEIRKGTTNLVENLKKVGFEKIVMLTGDSEGKAKRIANQIGIKEVYAGLLPKQKLEKVEELKKQAKVIFVGDGINDSPVLAAADFSISMGEGTQIANDTSDAILISNQIEKISGYKKVAKKTIKIVYFNILFSLLLKCVVLVLGVLGIAPIWLAVFADVGVTLITVLLALSIAT